MEEKMGKCTIDGEEFPRRLLLAKRVNFVEIGNGNRSHRSRTLHWLCPAHVASDPDWNLPQQAGRSQPPVRGESETIERTDG